jgi:hypothetical protein
MAAAACPPYGELLAALESEFRPVDRDHLDGTLDELARPLFGLEAAPRDERALALGRAAWAAVPDEANAPAAWLLGSALDAGCAAGPVRAALAAELGRRAGLPVHPARLRGCWVVHVPGDIAGVAIDLGADAASAPAGGPRGCLCAHQLAFVVLTSLVDAWQSAGSSAHARHARVLSLALSRGARA